VITLAALHVKEMRVPHIAVKALSEEHGRILAALGIHEIVHPEKDAATRLARRLSRPDLLNYIPLLPGYSITETKTPAEFVGKSLRQLALRNTLRVQLIAIRRSGNDMNIMPSADDVLEQDDVMILLGADPDLDHVREIVREPRWGKILPK
jgi:trk system potassium uptake protein TrkA